MVTSSRPSGAMRVLIADGDRLFTERLMQQLSAEDWIDVVGSAGDGKEAVELAASLLPDLVLMNVEMRGVHGIEATRRISENVQSMCVLLMSAVDAPKDVDLALRAGAAGLVRKDSVSPDLIATIFGLASLGVALDPTHTARDRADVPIIR